MEFDGIRFDVRLARKITEAKMEQLEQSLKNAMLEVIERYPKEIVEDLQIETFFLIQRL